MRNENKPDTIKNRTLLIQVGRKIDGVVESLGINTAEKERDTNIHIDTIIDTGIINIEQDTKNLARLIKGEVERLSKDNNEPVRIICGGFPVILARSVDRSLMELPEAVRQRMRYVDFRRDTQEYYEKPFE